MKFTFNINYFFLFAILLLVEIAIALFIKDAIVRPYVGDYLVVILLYCMVRTVIDCSSIRIAAGVLLFAYAVEWFQYINILDWLGLRDNHFANVVIGNRFEWIDMVAYSLGIITVIIIERQRVELNKH